MSRSLLISRRRYVKQQDDQKGRPARPEGAKPPERTPVREEAERLRTPLVAFFSILFKGPPFLLATFHNNRGRLQ